MRIVIDEKVCKDLGMDISEVLAVLLVKTGVEIKSLFQSLIEKEVLVHSETLFSDKWFVTQRWNDVCDNIILTSDNGVPKDDRVETLARELMEVFPKGKKDGTSTYWRGNVKDTKLRLKKFFKLYGDKYTDEQILKAAKQYVQSFNGNYSYMRVLKYFIWKDERKMNQEGEIYVEEVSDLATLIENEGSENYRDNWNTELK